MKMQLSRLLLGGIAALLVVAPASAKLEIVNIKAAYGPLGPDRKEQTKIEVYPTEQLFFRYMVAGASVDDKGNIKGTFQVKVLDTDGKVQLDDKSPVQGLLALGGGTFPGVARVNFAPTVPPGKYRVLVTFTDSKRDETVSFEREVTVKPAAFAVINPQFFHDSQGKIAAPAGGHVNQTLFFRTQLIGFDHSQKKIETKMSLQVLDKDGKELMPQALVAKAGTTDADEAAKATSLNYNGNLALNRAGDFTLRIVYTDEVAKKETKLELPIKVQD